MSDDSSSPALPCSTAFSSGPDYTLFDTHAHLNDEQLWETRAAVWRRAVEAGVRWALAVGTTVATSRECVRLAAEVPGIQAAVGIHPNYCAAATNDDWAAIVRLADEPQVVALGETGLDRHWDDCPFAIQQDFFDRHLLLGQQRQLPVVIHMRDCELDILEALWQARRRGPISGIMHSFAGSWETAAECLELGLHISFSGMITYKKNESLRDVARRVPADRLLVETDCPYLSPHPVRSQRPNEPALVVHTAACLADVRGISLPELAELTTRNAQSLFRRVRDAA
ncbi:MAG: TatD family hydrolase [Planctomycetota bacterium]